MIDQEVLSLAEKTISSCVLRTRMRSPFFATLMLFTKCIPSADVTLCAVDGENLYYNPSALLQLTARQQDGVLVHAILHASLFHYEVPLVCALPLWNHAADIVVNGIIAQNDFLELIPGALRDKKLEDKPVAEIYEILMARSSLTPNRATCFACNGETLNAPSLRSPQEKTRLRAKWQQALRQAILVQRSQGSHSNTRLPEWLEQLTIQLEELNDDWRSSLWRFLVKTPSDFDNFDRRLVSRGLYLEGTRTDEVKVIFGVDFECGIEREQSAVLLDELNKILSAYPHLQPTLVFQHNELFGPFDPRERLPAGYRSQRAISESFWTYVAQESEQTQSPTICVYLTDGMGEIPDVPMNVPVLWLIIPGGCRLDKVLFGRAVRFLRLV